MKKLFRIVLIGALLSTATLHAQKTSIAIQPVVTPPVQTEPISIDWSSASDVQVMLQAIQSLPTVPADSVRPYGNFYSAQHAPGTQQAWPPLPGDARGVPVWDLGNGMYLMDDLDVDYSASLLNAGSSKFSAMSMSAEMSPMDVPSPGGGGDSGSSDLVGWTNNYDYGTNLFIAQVSAVSNLYSGILSNSIADVSYEIQYVTDLTQTTNWQSANWFVNGSELTNWTPFSVPMISPTNLFLRARSWASDNGSSLPDWWVEQYYGTNQINPDTLDGAGDGWTIAQKFAMGVNPTTSVTPPTPQGLAAVLNAGGTSATISWLPSPVPVTSYTVEDSDGNTFNYSAGTENFDDSTSDFSPDVWDGNIDTTFKIQAHYPSGDSAWSAPVTVEEQSVIAAMVAGPNGTAYIAVSALPPNTAAIRMTEYDDYPLTPVFVTNFDIPISNFTNGFCPLPNNTPSGDGNFRQYWTYYWQAQAVGTNGNGLTATTWLGTDYSSAQDGYRNNWLVPPFFDGRAQLKQNLIFQLRAAVIDRPFQYTEIWTNYYGEHYFVSSPTNYAYAGYYYFEPYNTDSGVEYTPLLDWFLPFEENYFDRNFVFSTSDLDPSGHTTTGVGGQYNYDYYGDITGGLTIQGGMTTYYGSSFNLQTAYFFQGAATNGTPIASVLATNQTRWLSTYALDSDEYFLTPEIGVTNWYDTDWDTYYNTYFGILPNSVNYFGLPFVSDKVAWSSDGGSMDTLYANSYIENEDGYFYPETAQPQFETVEYDAWIAPNYWYNVFTNGTDFPGMAGLSLAHTNSVLITGVGQNSQIACYAKLAVVNSAYSGVYGFLQQYFDQAYKVDDNGNVTTNTTGVLSPYGAYFATEPGVAALVTMPDVDTGERGTNYVYAIKLGLDVNHDGTIDTSFAGADNTSATSPYVFWRNDNFDRGHTVDFTDYEQDDLETAPTPDYDYVDNFGNRIIPCTRDLEDFARLWICGITSNLLAALPTNSTVTLSWGDVGSPNPNNPTIDLFMAADADGGIGYLTNETVAADQIGYNSLARLSPGQSIQLNANEFGSNWRGNHFIWCGVSNGTGGLELTISDGNGNVLAQTTTYIQIKEIKEMYERWTAGDNPNLPPTNSPVLATEDLPTGEQAFQYAAPHDPNTPYILFVHGWNMTRWSKDRFAETAYKRLYWQGYQGRFGLFRWPTLYAFPAGEVSFQAFNPDNFDTTEFQSWRSGTALRNLLVQLNNEYPGQVRMFAHSHGNIAAGEALRTNVTLVHTYIAMQAAVPSHAYDPTTTNRFMGIWDSETPERTAQYWTNGAPCYFNGISGTTNFINFYNFNDWALDWWTDDQNLKPDAGYEWIWQGDNTPELYKYTSPLLQVRYLTFPTDTYEIFSYITEGRCYAVGQQANVHGVFDSIRQVDLSEPPYSFGTAHKGHSAEFRNDNENRWPFWEKVLEEMDLK